MDLLQPPRTLRLLLALALAAAALAACAPTTRGAAANAPLRFDGQTLAMEAGQTIYLEQSLGYSQVGFRPGSFRGSFWVPLSASAESTNATNEFSLRDPNLPGGWTLEVVSVRAVRAAAASNGPSFRFGRNAPSPDEVGGVAYTFEVIYALSAPPTTPRGRYHPRATLVSRQGGSAPVEFDVRLGG